MQYAVIQITAETEEKMKKVLKSLDLHLKADEHVYDFEYEELGEYS